MRPRPWPRDRAMAGPNPPRAPGVPDVCVLPVSVCVADSWRAFRIVGSVVCKGIRDVSDTLLRSMVIGAQMRDPDPDQDDGDLYDTCPGKQDACQQPGTSHIRHSGGEREKDPKERHDIGCEAQVFHE